MMELKWNKFSIFFLNWGVPGVLDILLIPGVPKVLEILGVKGNVGTRGTGALNTGAR